jgi:hypothetical protein
MDSNYHELGWRGLSVITCRPDDGQDSTASEVQARTCFGVARTEAGGAIPTRLQRAASDVDLRGMSEDWRANE